MGRVDFQCWTGRPPGVAVVSGEDVGRPPGDGEIVSGDDEGRPPGDGFDGPSGFNIPIPESLIIKISDLPSPSKSIFRNELQWTKGGVGGILVPDNGPEGPGEGGFVPVPGSGGGAGGMFVPGDEQHCADCSWLSVGSQRHMPTTKTPAAITGENPRANFIDIQYSSSLIRLSVLPRNDARTRYSPEIL